MEDLLYYNESDQAYNAPISVPLAKLLNGFTVKNTGNTIAIVNGAPVNPNGSKGTGGNRGEIYMGRLDIAFQLPVPAPPVPINQVVVTQKYYINRNQGYDSLTI
jgi:hypothetical protein